MHKHRSQQQKKQILPSQPNSYQQEDLEISNRDGLLQEYNCANSSFHEPGKVS